MKSRVVAGAAVLVAVVGLLDYLTGTEMSFAVFYVLPLAWVAWSVGTEAGVVFAVLSAVTWHAINMMAGPPPSHVAIPFWNTATRLVFFLIITGLIHRWRLALEHTGRLARTDPLTGALNGRAFRALAALELERHRRHRRPFTLVYADLDNFKTVNDTQGHAAGDEVLRFVAAELGRALRATDALARLGGDEFAMLLVETDAADAGFGVDRVRRRIGEGIRSRGWPVTLSMGVVTCEAGPDDIETLLQVADRELYAAKRVGKDRVSVTVFPGPVPPPGP